MTASAAVQDHQAERERWPLEGADAVAWAEVLLRLDVPQRFLLDCWPGSGAGSRPHVDPFVWRALRAASERVWRGVKLGETAGAIVARERGCFEAFAFRADGKSSLSSPWLSWRSLAAIGQHRERAALAELFTPYEYSPAHLDLLRQCADLCRAEQARLAGRTPAEAGA